MGTGPLCDFHGASVQKKNGGEKKNKGHGGEKKEEDHPLTVVKKIDKLCDGCRSKIGKSVKSFNGVDGFKADFQAIKLTVVGKVDPSKLLEMPAEKTKKKVELISSQQSKKDDNKNGNQKKPDGEKPKDKVYGDGGKKKKEDNPLTVVLEIDMHCKGCYSKIINFVKSFDGVDKYDADFPANKLTVVGKVDPSKLLEMLVKKTKKKVELISPKQSKKDDNKNGNQKKPDGEKPKDKYGDGGKKKKEDNPRTVVLKIDLRCDVCASKIVKSVEKFDGVVTYEADFLANELTVVGKVDPWKLRDMLADETKNKVVLKTVLGSKDFNKNDNKKKPDEKKPKNY